MKRDPKLLPETREVAWTICPGETAIVQAEQDKTTILIRESWVNKFLDNIPGKWPFGKDEAAIALAAKFTEEFSRLERESFLRELRNQCVVNHISSGLIFFKAEVVDEYISQWDIPSYIVYLPNPDSADIPRVRNLGHESNHRKDALEAVMQKQAKICPLCFKEVKEIQIVVEKVNEGKSAVPMCSDCARKIAISQAIKTGKRVDVISIERRKKWWQFWKRR